MFAALPSDLRLLVRTIGCPEHACENNDPVAQVANDDLCLNLEAAYDLSPAEYDEVGVA